MPLGCRQWVRVWFPSWLAAAPNWTVGIGLGLEECPGFGWVCRLALLVKCSRRLESVRAGGVWQSGWLERLGRWRCLIVIPV